MKYNKILIKLLAVFLFVFTFSQVSNIVEAATYPEFCAVANRTLKLGDTGEDVKRLQIVLGQEGIAYLGGTGYFGPVTERAVKIFQNRAGIYAVGKVGPQTLARMRSLWCQNTGGPTGGQTGDNNSSFINLTPTTSSGNNLNISWSATNARTCSLNGEQVSPSGTRTYTVTAETNFTLSCVDLYNKNFQKTITVKPNQVSSTLPSVNATINPTLVTVGQTANLYWNSQNTSYCTSNFTQAQLPVVGSYPITVLSGAQTYIVTCFNTTGQSSSVTVTTNGTGGVVGGTGDLQITSQNGNTVSISVPSCSFNGYVEWGDNTQRTDFYTQNNQYANCTTPLTHVYPNSGTYTIYVRDLYGVIKYSRTVTVSGGTSTGNTNVTINTSNTSIGNTNLINWNYYNTGVASQGVLISLVDQSGNYVGHITKDTNNPSTGSFNWTLPVVVYGYGGDVASCITVNGQQYCGVSPREIKSGSYKIRAVFFTPSTACFGFCQQVSGQQTLATVESQVFTINSTNTGTTNTISSFTGTYNSNTLVNMSWTGTGSNTCSLYRYTSLGPTDQSYYESNKVLIASGLPVTGTYQTQFIGTSGNFPVATQQFGLECGGVKSNTSVTSGTIGGNSPSFTLTANPTNVTYSGQPVMLSISGYNLSYCSVSSGSAFGINQTSSSANIISNGSLTVYPTNTTTYSVNCVGTNGSTVTQSVTVTLNGTTGSVTPVINVSANPTYLTYGGQPSVITVNGSNISYCSISGGNLSGASIPLVQTLQYPNPNSSGSYTVYPYTTATYNVNCTGTNGSSVNQSLTLTVTGTQDSGTGVQPTVNISVSPNIVYSGQPVTVTWSSSNANYCTLFDGDITTGAQAPSGSVTVYPPNSAVYQVTCYNNSSGQDQVNQASVVVNGDYNFGGFEVYTNQNRVISMQTVVGGQNGSCSSGYISWGDGTTSNLNSSSGGSNCLSYTNHTYNTSGRYTVSLYVNGVFSDQMYVDVY